MNKIGILNALIDYYSGGIKAKFAEKIGVKPQTINTWLLRGSFDTELIYSKCEYISGDWLLTGEGEMFRNRCSDKHFESIHKEKEQDFSHNKESLTLNAPKLADDPNVGKPYYDVDFIGGFTEIFNSQVSVPATNIVIRGFEKADLWCNVTGHSMEPKINHGDIIALRQCTLDDVQYGEIYAVVLDTIRTIKILRKSDDPDKFRFIPINLQDFDEQEYPKSRILNIFEVIGSISKFF